MNIIEILDQVCQLLQQKGKLSYRILKLQFELDDEQLETLKDELIEVQELAVDKDGKMLVWTGGERSEAPEDGENGQGSSPSLRVKH